MERNRIALLCLIDKQAIDDLFPGTEMGLIDEWVIWTHRIGASSVPELRRALQEWRQLNLYSYVRTAPNMGSVSFRAQFDDFRQLNGKQKYRGMPCYTEFHFTTFEILSPPYSLNDFINVRKNRPIGTPVQLRRYYRYVLDPAYVEDKRTLQTTQRRRRQPRSLVSVEASYLRRNHKQVIEVYRHHDAIAKRFVKWLKACGVSEPELERDFLDVTFVHKGKSYLVEIKTTHGATTRQAMREALGQVLEYSYYYEEPPADRWIILLDSKPVHADRNYLYRLRTEIHLPLILAWSTKKGFSFSTGPDEQMSSLPLD